MTVVGAGVIGVEYASMFAAMGTRVTLVDARSTLLPFIDREIAIALRYLLRRRNVSFRFGEEVVGVDREDGRVLTRLKSGKTIQSHTLMYATGRQGATEHLRLERAGLTCDKRGRIEVDDDYRTAVPHIFAVGDVAGPPGLAATSMEQGRIAALRAYGQPVSQMPELVPIGIYAIPEISYVGATEEELTEAAIPYVVGVAWWRELAKALMTGEEDGMLKILVSPDDNRTPRRARHRLAGHRPGPHRPGAHGPRRRAGLPRLGGLQLPDARRGLQGRRPRRAEPTTRPLLTR